MAFRFILVGAVATLGFELPSGGDLESLVRSGKAWYEARVAELEARHGIAIGPASDAEVDGDAPVVAPSEDAIFAAVVEDVVTAFASDDATVEPGDDVATQPVAGVDDAMSDLVLADALNRWVVGLSPLPGPALLAPEAGITTGSVPNDDAEPEPSSELAQCAEWFDVTGSDADWSNRVSEGFDPDSQPQGDAGLAPGSSETESGQRLARAMRLTGRALQAWMSLLHYDGAIAATR